MSDSTYNFGPVAPDEDLVYGACRPGHHWYTAGDDSVADWVAFMQERGIDRVCCLLSEEQLTDYDDLLGTYEQAFGENAVCHAAIPDYELVSKGTFLETIRPFVAAGVAADQRTVVHCSAGQGRTGHVLALWLASARGYSIADAVATVRDMGRSPLEAEGATLDALEARLRE